MEENTKETATNQQLKCKECGAFMKFLPGSTSLTCEYCGALNEIEKSQEKIEEVDFNSFIVNKFDSEEKQSIVTVKCTSCGASTTLRPNVTSDICPFCGTSLVVTSGSTSSILKPKSLLPFVINQKQGSTVMSKDHNILIRNSSMKTLYRIYSDETGEVLLKKRKIAKALRWWLRENGHDYTSSFFLKSGQ